VPDDLAYCPASCAARHGSAAIYRMLEEPMRRSLLVAITIAGIVTRSFPGARVLEAELDERAGGPIWEIEFELRGDDREVEVDAVTGAIGENDDD
jgi:hypothetical protein